ncbi:MULTISPECIES: PfkB family carbohydrate kinase [unclassified Paenibacillus]|uniref:carbohydrate kinase family protein n=1 Tax=unclassified Paenibacillus TaxID=185978 RepID=UPI001AE627B1|nr:MULTISPECIES: PfkB family carbohydrate kinase [unclassified Paenibacillus]MBP1157452.1 pseudouridine kinase [Paenibacillus sp. PvP091]MBP1171810.1 pseudouridine kinase [Paenibacillus sp. PvR098]MBP2438191.1 pseudouridine kinase [Paenibacillus sp. PvP052]
MTSFVSVIGTIFVDCKGFAQQNYNPTGRNLGTIGFVHGGVGRNVAENMVNLELPVAFVSTVDDTGLGEEIKKRLVVAGINTEYLKSTPSEGMGMWLAILDEHGDLAGSVSQMPNLATLENLFLKNGEEIIKRSTHIVLELDLNETLTLNVLRLADQVNRPVYGIPGNLDVIMKNPTILQRLDCFICNNIEAEKIISDSFNDLDVEGKIQKLREYVDIHKLASMVVTLGEEGSIYYDSKSNESGYQPVFPVKLVDSTGAGDAFFSGTVMGLARGLKLSEAVICGTKVAGWTIEFKENNCPELKERFKKDEVFQSLFVK